MVNKETKDMTAVELEGVVLGNNTTIFNPKWREAVLELVLRAKVMERLMESSANMGAIDFYRENPDDLEVGVEADKAFKKPTATKYGGIHIGYDDE